MMTTTYHPPARPLRREEALWADHVASTHAAWSAWRAGEADFPGCSALTARPSSHPEDLYPAMGAVKTANGVSPFEAEGHRLSDFALAHTDYLIACEDVKSGPLYKSGGTSSAARARLHDRNCMCSGCLFYQGR